MNEQNGPRTCVVTGATSGIGLALVEHLLELGLDTIGVSRTPERCRLQEERLSVAYSGARVAYVCADLSLQANVRRAAEECRDLLHEWGYTALDGLVNNAGTFTFWQTLTAEGFEMQWAVNHLAPFLLTHELLPLLLRSPDARVITISSASHRGGRLRWRDIQLLERYSPLRAYKQTKMANVLFTAELNRRLGPSSPVRAVAADPGLVDTDIGKKSGARISRWFWSLRRRGGIPPERSAAGIAALLFDPTVRTKPDVLWKHAVPLRPDPYALQEAHGWRLWEISAQMTGIGEKTSLSSAHS